MSSKLLEALKDLRNNPHNVGSLNNWNKNIVNQGARVKVADPLQGPQARDRIDNWTMVELEFNGTTGERECKALAADGTEGYLVATPEDYMEQYETISSFFNAGGEMARIVRLESGVRFECSNVDFHMKTGNEPHADHKLKNGQMVHYRAADRKFVISNNSAANGVANMADGYDAARNKFYLVDKDCSPLDGRTVYRFEVQ
jgi:hypothetical protein